MDFQCNASFSPWARQLRRHRKLWSKIQHNLCEGKDTPPAFSSLPTTTLRATNIFCVWSTPRRIRHLFLPLTTITLLSWAATSCLLSPIQQIMWWSALVSDEEILSTGLTVDLSQGQRYHVVVTASPKETSGVDSTANAFWIRTIPAAGCSGFINGGTPDERQGIIWYGGSNLIPTTQRNNYSGYSLACRDEPYDKLVPIVPWTVGNPSNVRK